MEVYEPVILQMREEGKTRCEIAEHLGLTKKQIKGWINRYNHKQRRLAAGIVIKPNCYDNAMTENFFSILKTECIYRHKPKTFREAIERIDSFIYFYNYERIQLKTGVAPLSLRHSA